MDGYVVCISSDLVSPTTRLPQALLIKHAQLFLITETVPPVKNDLQSCFFNIHICHGLKNTNSDILTSSIIFFPTSKILSSGTCLRSSYSCPPGSPDVNGV